MITEIEMSFDVEGQQASSQCVFSGQNINCVTPQHISMKETKEGCLARVLSIA